MAYSPQTKQITYASGKTVTATKVSEGVYRTPEGTTISYNAFSGGGGGGGSSAPTITPTTTQSKSASASDTTMKKLGFVPASPTAPVAPSANIFQNAPNVVIPENKSASIQGQQQGTFVPNKANTTEKNMTSIMTQEPFVEPSTMSMGEISRVSVTEKGITRTQASTGKQYTQKPDEGYTFDVPAIEKSLGEAGWQKTPTGSYVSPAKLKADIIRERVMTETPLEAGAAVGATHGASILSSQMINFFTGKSPKNVEKDITQLQTEYETRKYEAEQKGTTLDIPLISLFVPQAKIPLGKSPIGFFAKEALTSESSQMAEYVLAGGILGKALAPVSVAVRGASLGEGSVAGGIAKFVGTHPIATNLLLASPVVGFEGYKIGKEVASGIPTFKVAGGAITDIVGMVGMYAGAKAVTESALKPIPKESKSIAFMEAKVTGKDVYTGDILLDTRGTYATKLEYASGKPQYIVGVSRSKAAAERLPSGFGPLTNVEYHIDEFGNIITQRQTFNIFGKPKGVEIIGRGFEGESLITKPNLELTLTREGIEITKPLTNVRAEFSASQIDDLLKGGLTKPTPEFGFVQEIGTKSIYKTTFTDTGEIKELLGKISLSKGIEATPEGFTTKYIGITVEPSNVPKVTMPKGGLEYSITTEQPSITLKDTLETWWQTADRIMPEGTKATMPSTERIWAEGTDAVEKVIAKDIGSIRLQPQTSGKNVKLLLEEEIPTAYPPQTKVNIPTPPQGFNEFQNSVSGIIGKQVSVGGVATAVSTESLFIVGKGLKLFTKTKTKDLFATTPKMNQGLLPKIETGIDIIITPTPIITPITKQIIKPVTIQNILQITEPPTQKTPPPPVQTPIPPPITIFSPIGIPSFGFPSGKKKGAGKQYPKKTQYAPSLFAEMFNIKAPKGYKKKERWFSGFEIRPL